MRIRVVVSSAILVAGIAALGWSAPGATGSASAPVAAPTPVGPVASSSFRQVDPSRRWQQLAPGEVSTCGIDLRGAAWCWGDNSQGELGNPSVRSWSQTP